MQNLPEGLIYVLVLAVAFLANHFLRQFAPKMEPEPTQAESGEEEMAQEPLPIGLAAASITLATALLGSQAVVVKPRLPSHLGGQLPKRTLLGSKRTLQNAIAMATILGPCKAFEPQGNHASPGR